MLITDALVCSELVDSFVFYVTSLRYIVCFENLDVNHHLFDAWLYFLHVLRILFPEVWSNRTWQCS